MLSVAVHLKRWSYDLGVQLRGAKMVHEHKRTPWEPVGEQIVELTLPLGVCRKCKAIALGPQRLDLEHLRGKIVNGGLDARGTRGLGDFHRPLLQKRHQRHVIVVITIRQPE